MENQMMPTMPPLTTDFSHSRIKSFIECPKKYYWSYIRKIRPKHKSLALSLGSCMASALSTWRSTGSYDQGEDAFLKAWLDDGQALAQLKSDDPMRSVERGLEILKRYTETYPEEPEQTIQAEVWFEKVEVVPADDEVSLPMTLSGRIDGIMRQDGRICINEDKTTSFLGPAWFREKKNSYQVLWYMAVAKKLGLFDIAQASQSLQGIINAIYINAKQFRFERELTIKTSSTLEVALQSLRAWIKTIRMHEAANHFPEADSEMCQCYGGCDFLSLHGVPENRLESYLNSEFEPKKEEPTR